MADRIPAEVFSPGEYIRDELEARDWTQADLAFILGRPLQTINEIIAGKRAITIETAKGLAKAFGTSAEFWMNLETAYRLSQAGGTDEGDDEVARRAKLYALAPVKEMMKRRWIDETDDVEALERQLVQFFEVRAIEESPSLQFAARTPVPYAELSPAPRAWLCRAKRLARGVRAAKYDASAIEQGLAALHRLTASEHETRRVPRLLADMGVRLVLLEHLPKTRIDGAAVWLDDQTPIVVLSMRYDRIDHFWFTLYHEMMHIKHRDAWSLDEGLVGVDATPTTEKPEFEQRADREAAEILIPTTVIENFISRVRPLYSKKRIIQFANRIQVHPGIIVGQLQRRGEVGYGHSREMLVKVRSVLKEAALTDGWGDAPPLR